MRRRTHLARSSAPRGGVGLSIIYTCTSLILQIYIYTLRPVFVFFASLRIRMIPSPTLGLLLLHESRWSLKTRQAVNMASNPFIDSDDDGDDDDFSTLDSSWREWKQDEITPVLQISQLQASFHNTAVHKKTEGVMRLLSPEDCVRCALFLQAHKATHRGVAQVISYHPRGRLWVQRYASFAEYFMNVVDLFTVPDTTVLRNIGVRGMTSGYTGSDEALAFVQKQICLCVDSHLLCGGDEPRALPTRIIDLRDSEVVRLCETKNTPGRYAALSYCWGQDQNLSTTSATYRAHMNGISKERLPKTFMDAMDVCRRISIDFIWIDSLCIIQDSPGDWSNESAKMGDVYTVRVSKDEISLKIQKNARSGILQ
jgi:hypothetical protein